jgi:nitrogen regulatory protein PII
MELRKVTAIVRTRVLEDIEKRLRKMGIQGMSVSKVNYHRASSVASTAEQVRLIVC